MFTPFGRQPRPTAELNHLGTEFGEDRRRNAVSRAVSGVDDDLQAVEGELLREGALGVHDIATDGVIETLRAANASAGLAQSVQLGVGEQRLDLQLFFVGQLEAVGTEDS